MRHREEAKMEDGIAGFHREEMRNSGANLETGSFRDSFLNFGDGGERSTSLINARSNGGGEGTPVKSKSRETTLSSEELLSGSFSPWAPNRSSGELSPSQSFNTTFGFNNSTQWTSPARERSPFIKTSGNRGPLDFHSPPISSPVSSSEDSVIAATRASFSHDYASRAPSQRESTLEVDWTPTAGKDRFGLSPPMLDGSGGEGMRRGGGDGESLYQSSLGEAAFHYANRLSAQSSELQRTYSAGLLSGYNQLGQDMAWHAGHRGGASAGLFGGDHSQEGPLRSSTALERQSSYPVTSSGNETSLYKPYQPDPRTLAQYPPSLFSPTLDSQRLDALAFSTAAGGAEYSIFVGDLCPELREEDLVAQFLQPSAWPASHPFTIAYAHAQQAQGNYGTPAKVRPAPFTSTKSAKIMTDPLTGASRGFGFVRFSKEEDCARALIEMQGMVINPVHGTGRPLRVCTATPKNRIVNTALPSQTAWNQQPGEGLHPQQQHVADRLKTNHAAMPTSAPATASPSAGKGAGTSPFGGSYASNGSLLASSHSSTTSAASAATYSNSALDPNNTTVFVGGLSSLISEDTLKTFFAPFGEIIYVKIPPGKGCGFVQFVQKSDAERAIERMQGFPIGGGRIRLSWGRSQGDKAAAAAAQAVAQTAQMSHLANLAGLGALTPSQLSRLAGASLATPSTVPINDASSLLLRRLAAAAAATTPSLGRESDQHQQFELGRLSSLHHLPSMEHQHRQAHQQALQQSGQPNGGLFDSFAGCGVGQSREGTRPAGQTLHASHWTDGEEQRGQAYRGDDQLSSLFPSLRLSESDRVQLEHSYPHKTPLSPLHHLTSTLAMAGNYDNHDHLQQLSVESKHLQLLAQSSSSFSPFSPSMSPEVHDDLPLPSSEGEQAEKSSTREHQQEGANSGNPFKRYLELERQREQQRHQQDRPFKRSSSPPP